MSSALDELIARFGGKFPDEVKKLAAETMKRQIFIPNPGPQTDAYFSPADLLYYGGSAGSGKSLLLLGLAAQEHRVSRLFRRQFKDIDGQGGLAPALADLLGGYDGYNSQKHVWKIPGDPVRHIEFGAFESEKEASDYQGRAADLLAFDEAVQFQESLIRFLMGWNRTKVKGQRCRTVFASNPPVTAEGLWVIDWFGPWLDPRHPNPAKPGELRWYTMIDGVETEVAADYTHEERDASGRPVLIKPKSRTFIPGSLADNPDLAETGYASQLAGLPKHLKDALLGGIFKTSLEDDVLQIIPTEWILLAQQRWEPMKAEASKSPMTTVGVDVSMGGKDRTVIAPLHGVWFAQPILKDGFDMKNPAKVAGAVVEAIRDDPQINIDCGGGYGAGPAEHLEANGFSVRKCLGAEASGAWCRNRIRRFFNKRAERVWRLREALDPERGDGIALPPGREIVAELSSYREKRMDNGLIQAEDRADIIKRLGRSPDIADAIILAWAEAPSAARAERSGHRARRGQGRSLPVVRQYGNVAGRRS